jgi:hypothetical protein
MTKTKRVSGAAAIAMIALISCSAAAIADCVRKTDDAGRWRDPDNPAGTLAHMCSSGIDYYQGQVGKVIFQGRNPTDCAALVNYANHEQSWHGDWFLWSEIECDNGMKMFVK